jgi:hypothetical protein
MPTNHLRESKQKLSVCGQSFFSLVGQANHRLRQLLPQSRAQGKRSALGLREAGGVLYFAPKSQDTEAFMGCKTILGLGIVLALAAFSVAQTNISGTVSCAKPDQSQKIDIGDKPGHAYAISQGKCIWTKPMDIAGTQTHDDVGTNFDEMTPAGAHGHGYVLGTMANGDKFVARTDSKDAY